ncbi:MAG: amtR [Microbacteriaceae bacterium]|nr:amtR [Microbacteriaceae bacterium]
MLVTRAFHEREDVPRPAAQPRFDDSSLLPTHLVSTGAKGRLLAAALDLFSTRGYHGVSVRDITTRMGVQPSSLYAQFPSKADLFSELVYIANEEIRNRLQSELLSSGTEPEAQLRALVRNYVEFHATWPLLASIAHNDLHVLSGQALDRVAASRRQHVELVRSVIVRGNELGVFDCADPWVAVAAIAAMGIRVATWYIPPGIDGDQARGFAEEVRLWMGPGRSVESVVQSICDYAVRIVGTAPARPAL